MNCSKLVAIAFLMMAAGAFGQSKAAPAAKVETEAELSARFLKANEEGIRIAQQAKKQVRIWFARIDVANDNLKAARTPEAIQAATAAKLAVAEKNRKEALGFNAAILEQYEIGKALVEKICHNVKVIVATKDASSLTDAEIKQLDKCDSFTARLAKHREVLSTLDGVVTMLGTAAK